MRENGRGVLVEGLGIEPGRRSETSRRRSSNRTTPGCGGLVGTARVPCPAALDPAGTALSGRTAEMFISLRLGARPAGHGWLVSVAGAKGSARRGWSLSWPPQSTNSEVVVYARCDHPSLPPRAVDQALRTAGSSVMHAQLGAIPGESSQRDRSPARRLGIDAPVLVVLDDLHEADAEVLEVVAEVSATVSDAAVLVVAVFRTQRGDVPRPAPSDQQVLLEPVDRIAVAAICELYGDDWSVADIDRLFEESRGSPARGPRRGDLVDRVAATRRVDEAVVRHSSPSSASPARSRPSRTKSSACSASWSNADASSATATSVRHPSCVRSRDSRTSNVRTHRGSSDASASSPRSWPTS